MKGSIPFNFRPVTAALYLKGNNLKPLLYLVNIFLGLLVIAWPVGFIVVIFMFDAPGSESNFLTLALALSILIYPKLIFYGSGRFFKGRKSDNNATLLKYTLISCTGPCLVILFVVLLDLL